MRIFVEIANSIQSRWFGSFLLILHSINQGTLASHFFYFKDFGCNHKYRRLVRMWINTKHQDSSFIRKRLRGRFIIIVTVMCIFCIERKVFPSCNAWINSKRTYCHPSRCCIKLTYYSGCADTFKIDGKICCLCGQCRQDSDPSRKPGTFARVSKV